MKEQKSEVRSQKSENGSPTSGLCSLNSVRPGIIELDGSQYSALRMELEVERRVRRQQNAERKTPNTKHQTPSRTTAERITVEQLKQEAAGLSQKMIARGAVRSAAETDYEQLKREAAGLSQKMIARGVVKVIPPEVQAQAVRDEKAEYERDRRRVLLKCGLTTQGRVRVKPSKHTTGGVKLTESRAAYMKTYRREKFLRAGLTTAGVPRQVASKYAGQRLTADMPKYQRAYRAARS